MIFDEDVRHHKGTYLPVFTYEGEYRGFGWLIDRKCVDCGKILRDIWINKHFSAIAPMPYGLIIFEKQRDHESRSGRTHWHEMDTQIVRNPIFINYPKNSSYEPKEQDIWVTRSPYEPQEREDRRTEFVSNSCYNRFVSYVHVSLNEHAENAATAPCICNKCLIKLKNRVETAPIVHGHLSLFKIDLSEARMKAFENHGYVKQITIFNHEIVTKESQRKVYGYHLKTMRNLVQELTHPETALDSFYQLFYVDRTPRTEDGMLVTSPDHDPIEIEWGVYLAIHPWPYFDVD